MCNFLSCFIFFLRFHTLFSCFLSCCLCFFTCLHCIREEILCFFTLVSAVSASPFACSTRCFAASASAVSKSGSQCPCTAFHATGRILIFNISTLLESLIEQPVRIAGYRRHSVPETIFLKFCFPSLLAVFQWSNRILKSKENNKK